MSIVLLISGTGKWTTVLKKDGVQVIRIFGGKQKMRILND
jgi:hypothetical protein